MKKAILSFLGLVLLTVPALGEQVNLEWDLYVGTVDAIAVERSQDLLTWTEIVSLAPTAVVYIDDVGAGTWFWRVVAVVGAERSNTLKGVWKTVEVTSPSSMRTP